MGGRRRCHTRFRRRPSLLHRIIHARRGQARTLTVTYRQLIVLLRLIRRLAFYTADVLTLLMIGLVGVIVFLTIYLVVIELGVFF